MQFDKDLQRQFRIASICYIVFIVAMFSATYYFVNKN